MIDIDHFKKLNDSFGHTAGDVVLRAVAEVLRRSVRRGDAAARYGGEEFVILLPRTSRHQAVEVAEKIRRSIAADVVSPGQAGAQPARATESGAERRQKAQTLPEPEALAPPVTVSIGLASFPDDAKVELELIRVADGRLYQAKRSGRNQVCGA
jgi:GGDEF domain-containing protein